MGIFVHAGDRQPDIENETCVLTHLQGKTTFAAIQLGACVRTQSFENQKVPSTIFYSSLFLGVFENFISTLIFQIFTSQESIT